MNGLQNAIQKPGVAKWTPEKENGTVSVLWKAKL